MSLNTKCNLNDKKPHKIAKLVRNCIDHVTQ